jgi:hypothetical protein
MRNTQHEPEACLLLGYYAASIGNPLSTFRDNVSAPASRVKKSSWPLKLPSSFNSHFPPHNQLDSLQPGQFKQRAFTNLARHSVTVAGGHVARDINLLTFSQRPVTAGVVSIHTPWRFIFTDGDAVFTKKCLLNIHTQVYLASRSIKSRCRTWLSTPTALLLKNNETLPYLLSTARQAAASRAAEHLRDYPRYTLLHWSHNSTEHAQ